MDIALFIFINNKALNPTYIPFIVIPNVVKQEQFNELEDRLYVEIQEDDPVEIQFVEEQGKVMVLV